MMKYGVYLPPFGKYADVHFLAGLAFLAEKSGWDGFFIWDHILYRDGKRAVADPWVALAVIAANTSTIRIGPLITPIARRRPWKLARETVTLDHLSKGRLTLGVGLGSLKKWDFGVFGDEMDPHKRAKMLDEGLDVLTGFWSGEDFQFQGDQFEIEEVQFLPRTHQQPRIPIWVAGKWPNKAPMRRAARWDGACPEGLKDPLTPGDWKDIVSFVDSQRDTSKPYDYVHLGMTPIDDPEKARDIIQEYEEAGVTWWLEHFHPDKMDFPEWTDRDQEDDLILHRVSGGPPK